MDAKLAGYEFPDYRLVGGGVGRWRGSGTRGETISVPPSIFLIGCGNGDGRGDWRGGFDGGRFSGKHAPQYRE